LEQRVNETLIELGNDGGGQVDEQIAVGQAVAGAAYETKPPQNDAEASDVPPATPDAAVEWMNSRYFVVLDGGKAMVMHEERDADNARQVLKPYGFADIRNFYCNRFVDVENSKGESRPVSLGKFWQNHPNRRQYRGMVFNPNGERANYYNLWRGFSVQPVQGDWSRMDAHIRENICCSDESVYTYVRKWLAFAVQRPDTLPETALVMRGKQGTGKGVFATGFGRLFGQHFLHLTRSRNLVGNFNAHLRDAIVVFADEAFLVGDKESQGVLKALITEPELQIEQKFRDLVHARNLIHLVAASNNEQIIDASPEERRFCVLDVSDKRMQDKAYFAAIKKEMDEGGSAAMLYDLLHEDLSTFDVRTFPKTAALLDQKMRSMSPVLKWWHDKLQRGALSNDEWPESVSRGELATDCMTATRKQWTSQSLRNELVKVLPEGFPENAPRTSVSGRRERQWRFPALEACRRHFDVVMGVDGEWDDA
jgi:hypothetical protein